jgi:NAD(P)-dependent dehydrogenase (short-subunit alcohol dehydrogenase family)
LAADGFAIAALDIIVASAAATAELIEADGGTAIPVHADLTVSEEIARAFDETEERLGVATALVNNAGALSIGPFEQLAESEWDRIMDVNLKAPFFLTQEFARRLVDRGLKASVVNIGSVAGVRVMTNRAHYCSSKRGVQTLSAGQALELAQHGIRVNCIHPKAIESGMSGSWISAVDGSSHVTDTTWFDDPGQAKVVHQSLPLGVHGMPEDIANAVSYLVSDAADYITGATLDVDGGYLAGDMFTR